MKYPSKCGEVIITAEFVLGIAEEIEIACYFCADSFKSLESFSGHLKNIHKLLIQALSDYYLKIKKEKHSTEAADHSNKSTELSLHYNDIELQPTTMELNNEMLTDESLIPADCTKASKSNSIKFDMEPPSTLELDDEMSTNDEQRRDSDVDWPPSDSKAKTVIRRRRRVIGEKLQGAIPCSFSSKAAQEEVVLELIAQLEIYPVLWRYRCWGKSQKIDRRKATKEIFNYLKEKFPLENFNEEFIIRRLGRLKSRYYRAEIGKIPVSDVPYYEKLSFLKGKTAKFKVQLAIRNSAGRFQCPHCPKDYAKLSTAWKHILCHRNEYKHKCQMCDRQFIFPNELRSHMLIHTNEKPFVCEICGRSFRLSGKLKIHLKVHRNQKDYKCELCPKSYTRRRYLNDHMNTHLNLKPAKCETCKKRFSSRDLLRHHVKIHSDEMKYKCMLCDKAFAQASGRASHMRWNHKTLETNTISTNIPTEKFKDQI